MSEEPSTPDPAWWDAWRGVLFTFAATMPVVEKDMQRHSGMSLTFMDVLGRLNDTPGHRMRMTELQERALFTLSGMTRLVDRIEAEGLVERSPVPGDRRGVAVSLTEKGVRVYEAAMALHRADIERVFASRLTPEQQERVAADLWGFWHRADETPLPS